MTLQLDLSQCTLTIEQQAVVDGLNQFLAWLPDNEDTPVARRLALEILEAADVAPQSALAAAAGFAQERSVRVYHERLKEHGLAGLFDQPIPGRPAITKQPSVEKALIQVILTTVIDEQALPDDALLAERVNQALSESQAPEAGQVTASQVETLRLRWGIQRLPLQQALDLATPTAPETTAVQLGRTQVGGAFIVAVLLVESGWLKLAKLLPMAPGYAVTATQWLLTALFAVIFGVKRAFHLDDLCDLGFALVTGRPQPLSHSTFQHLLRRIPASAARKFYERSAKGEVAQLGEDDEPRRISLDGHNLARYTRVVDLDKGKIGNTGRILKAEELVWAYDLDARLWLGMRAYHGTNKLSQGLVEIVRELLKHRGSAASPLRLYFDKGGSCGHVFRDLLQLPAVWFYTFAKRTEENVADWEQLPVSVFAKKSFSFEKHAAWPAAERPTYRLADTEMTVNVWEDDRLVGTVSLRAIVLHAPTGRTPAERWPVVLLTNDREREARALLNEQGDHWGQEFAHRIGRHDLDADVLPMGYVLTSTRDEHGELQRDVDFDNTAFFLSAWLHCLVYNLMTRFAQALGGKYVKQWAGTLLRKFIRRPATLYVIGPELHVVFDPFPGQEELQPLLEKLNAKRVALPWLNHLIVQLRIAQGEPVHPLAAPEKRNRLFGDG